MAGDVHRLARPAVRVPQRPRHLDRPAQTGLAHGDARDNAARELRRPDHVEGRGLAEFHQHGRTAEQRDEERAEQKQEGLVGEDVDDARSERGGARDEYDEDPGITAADVLFTLGLMDRPGIPYSGLSNFIESTNAEGVRVDRLDHERASDHRANTGPGDTTYLCTAEVGGLAVSLIQSNASGFGSLLVEPNTGINLHNRGLGFNLVDEIRLFTFPVLLGKGKRLFKMAPLHHHLELTGWSELQVVGVFYVIAAILAAICLA